jgi:hypothetical protein
MNLQGEIMEQMSRYEAEDASNSNTHTEKDSSNATPTNRDKYSIEEQKNNSS